MPVYPGASGCPGFPRVSPENLNRIDIPNTGTDPENWNWLQMFDVDPAWQYALWHDPRAERWREHNRHHWEDFGNGDIFLQDMDYMPPYVQCK